MKHTITTRFSSLYILIFATFFVGVAWADMPGGSSMHDKQMESQMMSTQQATHEMMQQTMSQKSMQNMMQQGGW